MLPDSEGQTRRKTGTQSLRSRGRLEIAGLPANQGALQVCRLYVSDSEPLGSQHRVLICAPRDFVGYGPG